MVSIKRGEYEPVEQWASRHGLIYMASRGGMVRHHSVEGLLSHEPGDIIDFDFTDSHGNVEVIQGVIEASGRVVIHWPDTERKTAAAQPED